MNSQTLLLCRLSFIVAALLAAVPLRAQSLLNLDFAANPSLVKSGPAATGQGTNDFWNAYSHYTPKFLPGMKPVPDGRMAELKWADGSASKVSVTVTNAPGVWGNASWEAMFDTYVFAPNGSNMVVTLTGLDPGRYHLFLYGHADAESESGVAQDSRFTLRQGTRALGVIERTESFGDGTGARGRLPVAVLRDVALEGADPLVIEIAPGRGGVAVLNGLQILSRGTAPPRLAVAPQDLNAGGPTNLLLREVRYEGRVARGEARFQVSLDAESRSTNEVGALLFDGELAVIAPKLPEGWRIVTTGRQFRLLAAKPGAHRIEMEIVPRVQVTEPWRNLLFNGPAAAIATVRAVGTEPATEIQLLSGTILEGAALAAGVNTSTNLPSVQGALGMDRTVSMRWQSRAAEVVREAVVAADTRVRAQVGPAQIRYRTEIRLEVLQSRLGRAHIELPATQTVLQLKGDAVRAWQVVTTNGVQVVSVEFLRPVEGTSTLILVSEQPVGSLPGNAVLTLPRPLDVQRESGSLTVAAEDVLVQVGDVGALRQVNAGEGEVASFRFNSRPAVLGVALARVEPLVTVRSRVGARMEGSRLVLQHIAEATVARAGVYQFQFAVPAGLAVSEVRSDGLEDWKVADGRLTLAYRERVLGARRVEAQLEQAFTNAPASIVIEPMRLLGAERETAGIGVASERGIVLRTGATTGVQEIPIEALPAQPGETLAFRSEAPAWRIALSVDRQPARVLGEVFNLVTVGDGVVGGSATIRFGILNQGVQTFRVRVPEHWRNVEFTGANVRRTDRAGDIWTLSLQDKVWGAYTLVVTYDDAIAPNATTLDAAGVHLLDVEREEGTVAVTAAHGITLETPVLTPPLRPIDAAELAPSDRAMISRPVLLAGRYAGTNYSLTLALARHAELPLLDAVADRAQLTTVLTDSGEMLTQAGFLVKNNERQFQRFRLPPGATLWAVAVDGVPTKADRDGDSVLVPLPRTENRDEAFAIDLKYAQQETAVGGTLPRPLELVAPTTDVAGTYAEWEVYVPGTRRVSGFGGNMTVARGTTYGFRDGWEGFVRVYRDLWHEVGVTAVVVTGGLAFLVTLVVLGLRRGSSGVVGVIAVFAILAILGGMLLPALAKSKSRAQRINSVNNLKNLGLVLRTQLADGKAPAYPASLEELIRSGELNPKLLIDPRTGERFTYVGAGKSEENPLGILAYSTSVDGTRVVLMGDGSVQQVPEARFEELLREEAAQMAKAAGKTGKGAAMDPLLANRYGLAPRAGAEGAAAAPAGTGPAVATNGVPTATGVRSLRIDLPKSGVPYRFTRTLNLTREPAAVKFSVMSSKAYVTTRSAAQVLGFVAGLVVVWVQTRRSAPSSLWLAVGLAFALVATASVLVTWRVLHLALIVGVPAVALSGAAILVGRVLRRWRSDSEPAPLDSFNGTSPAAVALALLLALGGAGIPTGSRARAAEVAAGRAANSAKDEVSILSATYTGLARERVAEFDADFELLSATTNRFVALFGPEVAVRELKVTAGNARLDREGDRVGVLLVDQGRVKVRATILVKLTGDAQRRTLDFGPPPALAGALRIDLDESEALVEFPAALSFQILGPTGSPRTRVEAVLGAANRVTLSWSPRVRRGPGSASTVSASQASLITLGGGAVNTRSWLTWTAAQGELTQVRMALPAGQRVLKLSGETVRGWDVSPTNRQELLVDLLKPAQTVKVQLETERPLDAPPSTASLDVPRPLDVTRAGGTVAVRSAEEIALQVARTAGLERIDGAEFAKAAGDDKLVVQGAWRFQDPTFVLEVKTEAVRPRLEVVARNQFLLGTDRVSLTAWLDFTVFRAGVFAVSMAIPAEVRIESVTCAGMSMWTERTNATGRVLEIQLQQRTTGEVHVQVALSRPIASQASALELSGVRPLGVDKSGGFVSVGTEPGVGVKTSGLSGLVEIPVAAMGSVASGAEIRQSGLPPVPARLAYKVLPGDGSNVAPWILSLATERVAPWIRAEGVQVFHVSESLVRGRMRLRYTVENAPAKEFRVRVPLDWRNVEVTGAGIRSREPRPGTNGVEWVVEPQNRVLGEFELGLTWEIDRAGAGTNALVLVGAETVGVDRESGSVILTRQGQIQVAAKGEPTSLRRVDARELPEWVRTELGSAPAALSFSHSQSGWRLAVDVTHFNDAAVLSALVESVRLRSVVADDGQMMTQLDMAVRHNGRQHLAVRLPAGAEVWSAFVDGQPVRPARRGDSILLALERNGPGEAPIPVELTYVGGVRFPKSGGMVELISPQLDAPLKDARWEVFLPPDNEYSRFGGTMAWESADLVPVVQDFTVGEYGRQEIAKASVLESQTLDNLRQARSELAAGNVDRANDNLSQARSRAYNNRAAAGELKQIEDEVNRVQGSNLLQAQQSYFNNALNGAPGTVAPIQKLLAKTPDEEARVAELQVRRLQRAQAVATSRVAPLRVNLPTRGIRHAFAQVLQTGVDKPLTVRFHAQNTQQSGWGKTVALSAIGFFSLWGLAGVAVRPKCCPASRRQG